MKIVIRPSSLSTFVSCPRQWYAVNVLGMNTIPNVRAAIGTSIHKGAEELWKEAMSTQEKKPNLSMASDASTEEFDKILKESEETDMEELTPDDAKSTIVKGVRAFATDIMTVTPIPKAVEQTFSIPLKHFAVSGIRGTLDYIGKSEFGIGYTIADIKTSKRKVAADSHTLQQSMYKFLAEKNGLKVDSNFIQGIVLAKTRTTGSVEKLEPEVEQVRYVTNNLLDRLDALKKGIDPMLLFAGNPKHFLCSDKYCSLRATCPFVTGKKSTKEEIPLINI